MLGDLVYEAEGKVNGFKSLPNRKMGQTVAMHGVLFGEAFSDTYELQVEHRPDGTGFVELHGSLTTDSGVTIDYSGIGNGKRREDGSMIYNGAACHGCPSGKFARLNGMAVAWEMEVDSGGYFRGKGWEWK